MAMVFGKMMMDVMVEVGSEDEVNGVLEANYNLNPERIIAYKMIAIDCKGKEHEILINDCLDMNLTEFEE